MKTCPYCGEPDPAPGGPGGKFFRCANCDLIGRMELREEMPHYYEKRYFDEHAQDQLSGERNQLNEHILDLIEAETKRGSLLDIGCGCGFFLKSGLRRGWQVSGIDPSEKSIQYARTLVGDVVHRTALEDFEATRRFGVVTLINVLDHFQRPWEALRRVHSLLEKDGLVFIRIPNGRLHFLLTRSLQAFGGESLERFLVLHEYALTPRYLRRVLSDLGFTQVQIGNAEQSGTGGTLTLKRVIRGLSSFTAALSANRLLLAPSLEITARKESA